MREIKFRVRCRDTKKLIGHEVFNSMINDGYYYTLESEPEEDRVCYTNYSAQPTPKPLHPLSGLLREQFTCSQDINGVEIYEGDIVMPIMEDIGDERTFASSGVVVFLECSFIVLNEKDELATQLWHEVERWEVIGNIHQNANLLNES